MKNTEQKNEANTVINAYTKRLQTHGLDFRSLNWGSANSQSNRFEILTEMGITAGSSVLDVGCGLGDYWQWCQSNDIDISYTGIDITPEMVTASRRRFPKINFYEGDISNWAKGRNQKFDYVIASGIFYDRPEGGWNYMKESIHSMFNLCNVGIGFNTLTNITPLTEAGEYRPPLGQLTEYCATMTNRFTLRHDYHPSDATIYLFRQEPLGK